MPYRKKENKRRRTRRHLWTKKDMLELGQSVVNEIVTRTFTNGRGVDGRPFAPYSTTPIYVSNKYARLAPKGGRKTPKGRFYEGGYRQYKNASRRGRSRNAVDLFLTGQLSRALKVRRVTRGVAVVGLEGDAAVYGVFVNQSRRFIGLGPAERRRMRQRFSEKIRERLGIPGRVRLAGE